jgi:hypothetical protein
MVWQGDGAGGRAAELSKCLSYDVFGCGRRTGRSRLVAVTVPWWNNRTLSFEYA